jgi:hypothetical protein
MAEYKSMLMFVKAVPMLETNKDWDSFHRNVDSWTINEDLDEDRPAGVVVARMMMMMMMMIIISVLWDLPKGIRTC